MLGVGGNKPSDLTKLDNYTAFGVASLSWNILDFGRGAANVDYAKGQRAQYRAQYRMKVQSALQDAETSLAKYRYDRVNVAVLARAAFAADIAAELDQQRFRAGTLSMIDLISAQQTQITSQQNLSQAVSQMTNDFIGLHKSLGLGWSKPGCDVGSSTCIANVPPPRKGEKDRKLDR